jgi:hypothetical protein
MTKSVTLPCPVCGTKLQVPHHVEHFACGECATELAVRREGGIVFIEPAVDHDIPDAKIQVPISEAQFQQLEREVTELRTELNELQQHDEPQPEIARGKQVGKFLFIVGGIGFVAGAIITFFLQNDIGTGVLGIAFVVGTLGAVFYGDGVRSEATAQQQRTKKIHDLNIVLQAKLEEMERYQQQ